jgi:electron transport complex protein RnfG
MSQSARFGLTLGAICLAATLVLAITHGITKPKIDEQAALEKTRSLKRIMPEASSFEPKAAGGIEYFEAMKDGAVAGYCVNAVGSGYAGYIRMIVGIDTKDAIRGVEILEHQETPGLGAKIAEVRPGEKGPYFLRQFRGKQARTVAVGKDIDAITGATISSEAVTDAVRDTVNEFMSRIRR